MQAFFLNLFFTYDLPTFPILICPESKLLLVVFKHSCIDWGKLKYGKGKFFVNHHVAQIK